MIKDRNSQSGFHDKSLTGKHREFLLTICPMQIVKCRMQNAECKITEEKLTFFRHLIILQIKFISIKTTDTPYQIQQAQASSLQKTRLLRRPLNIPHILSLCRLLLLRYNYKPNILYCQTFFTLFYAICHKTQKLGHSLVKMHRY